MPPGKTGDSFDEGVLRLEIHPGGLHRADDLASSLLVSKKLVGPRESPCQRGRFGFKDYPGQVVHGFHRTKGNFSVQRLVLEKRRRNAAECQGERHRPHPTNDFNHAGEVLGILIHQHGRVVRQTEAPSFPLVP